MQDFAEKQHQPQPHASPTLTRYPTKPPAANQAVHPGAPLQPTTHLAHAFSQIPVFAAAPLPRQAKLTVNAPGDRSEQEADAIADQVTRTTDPIPSAPKPLSALFARIAQTKSESGAPVSRALSRRITSSQGGGSQMDLATQTFMQRRFGTDFSHVRVHTDADAAHLNRELGAYAFTVGRDIYFGSGQYAPATNPGRHLLAHELTHTLQQTHSSAIPQETAARRQSIEGSGFLNEEGRPAGGELPEAGSGIESEEGPEETEAAEAIQMQIQRSTKWVGATVHEDLNLAELIMNGGAPITWQMLNGAKLETVADADSSIIAPDISTSGSDKKWTAKVDTVPKQEGGDDETVLAPGPWNTTVSKDKVGTKYGFAACSGADDSTFSALGKPSDDAVYKGNRRHEDHHVKDDKVAFEQTVGKWDKKLEKAKSKGTKFSGEDADKAKAALWAAMGGTPKEIARAYRSLSLAKGGAFHKTVKGGTMKTSNAKANPDCSASSVEVRNPS